MTTLANPAKPRRKALVLIIVALCAAAAVFFAPRAWRAVQKQFFYPVQYTEYVEHWAHEYGVDPLLVYTIIKTESGFDANAVSYAEARGLMQMTEDTFDWIKGRIAPEEALTFDDMFVPDTSIRFGVYFFSISLEKYAGDISTAAAAYHSGWGTVDGLLESGKYSENEEILTEFPHEQMRHYVYKINNNYKTYKALYREQTT